MHNDILNLNEIKNLTLEYFELEKGVLIKNPDNKIFVGNINIHNTNYEIYFKNKTFKHFIERRKEDLLKRNSKEKTLKIIFGLVGDLSEAINNYTKLEINLSRKNSFLIYKDFDIIEKTPITIVAEKEKKFLFIISYYFTKR